jgi:hypothetical protein
MLVCLFAAGAVRAEPAGVLITAEEAARPQVYLEERGPLPGPQVRVVSGPSVERPARSPIHFVLRVSPFGGAGVDWQTFSATYMVMPRVDITERLRSAIDRNSSELVVDNAQVPAGKHQILFSVRDTNGLFRSATYTFVAE